MASIEEKIVSARKRINNERDSQIQRLHRTTDTQLKRMEILERTVQFVDNHANTLQCDRALYDMLLNMKREAEGLLQKEFDKLRIPA